MCAHADETDDVNDLGRIHPGASIVPAALAVAETYDRPGKSVLTAVALGYDVACSVNIGAWESFPLMHKDVRASHGVGQTFGSAAAAASLAGLSLEQTRYALSYAAQQVSGISTFYRDQEHIGKAFATAGMEAHAGVRAVELVRCGFTDISDVFDNSPNAYDAFGIKSDRDRLVQALGATHHVMTTDIKRYPIGGPIQPAAEALETLVGRYGLQASEIEFIEARVPSHGAWIVDSRTMPDISLQYILSVLLLDGAITFENSHDYERHRSEDTRAVMARIRMVPDTELDIPDVADPETRRTRRAIVTVRTLDGRTLTERVDNCLGSRGNPMSWKEVADKAHSVLDGVMGTDVVDDLVVRVRSFEKVCSARDLRRFFELPASATAVSRSA